MDLGPEACRVPIAVTRGEIGAQERLCRRLVPVDAFQHDPRPQGRQLRPQARFARADPRAGRQKGNLGGVPLNILNRDSTKAPLRGSRSRPPMHKSIYTQQHKRLCELLIEARKKASLTQTQIAERLGNPSPSSQST